MADGFGGDKVRGLVSGELEACSGCEGCQYMLQAVRIEFGSEELSLRGIYDAGRRYRGP